MLTFSATVIEVKVKDCGLSMVYVGDNGKGIEEKDFELITASHATSKIQCFKGTFSC